MLAKIPSLGVTALEGYAVTAEVDISGGLPQFAIVGLPDNAVKESTDRVRSALKNLGFTFPVSRITVNLAPADTRKTGSVYDLPLLLGILQASEQIRPVPEKSAFIGELSLGGEVRAVTGVLPMALACKKAGIKNLFLPSSNAQEAAVVEGLCVFPLDTAKQAIDHIQGETKITQASRTAVCLNKEEQIEADMADVRGQYEARRALEIAAAGMHNILFIGSPGAGKSMLAKRLAGILPPMTYEEAVASSKIYSVAGLLRSNVGTGNLITQRPFRSPHHSVSAAGLSGGGSFPKPGEISLAHNGVLFLDELPEFQREALEILRQPLEDGEVTVSRVAGSVTFPSRLLLVAAMNPCPCGYYGHPTKECRCSAAAMERYLNKVSGPLLDRIDLHVDVQPVGYEEISSSVSGEKSADVLKRVQAAHEKQKQRQPKGVFVPNAKLQGALAQQACVLTDEAQRMLKTAFETLGLSARGYNKVLRVSRTIADLDNTDSIGTAHVGEAIQYRSLDRKYWGT